MPIYLFSPLLLWKILIKIIFKFLSVNANNWIIVSFHPVSFVTLDFCNYVQYENCKGSRWFIQAQSCQNFFCQAGKWSGGQSLWSSQWLSWSSRFYCRGSHAGKASITDPPTGVVTRTKHNSGKTSENPVPLFRSFPLRVFTSDHMCNFRHQQMSCGWNQVWVSLAFHQLFLAGVLVLPISNIFSLAPQDCKISARFSC